MIRDEIDYYTRTGAARLAVIITSYWLSRGHAVKTRVQRIGGLEAPAYTITSNLVNGLPLKKFN